MDCGKCSSVCLVGDNLDYVLFKVAIEAASRGRRVWFISVKPFEEVPPEIQPPCKQVLQLITFIYLSDFARLMMQLNCIHKWKHLPSVVVVKGFDAYCNLSQSGCGFSLRGAAFLMATLLDCLRFLGRKQACSSVLVISCSKRALSEGADRLNVLVDMYLDFFFPPVEDSEGLLERIKALDLLN